MYVSILKVYGQLSCSHFLLLEFRTQSCIPYWKYIQSLLVVLALLTLSNTPQLTSLVGRGETNFGLGVVAQCAGHWMPEFDSC
jgi:hypothetical protein